MSRSLDWDFSIFHTITNNRIPHRQSSIRIHFIHRLFFLNQPIRQINNVFANDDDYISNTPRIKQIVYKILCSMRLLRREKMRYAEHFIHFIQHVSACGCAARVCMVIGQWEYLMRVDTTDTHTHSHSHKAFILLQATQSRL